MRTLIKNAVAVFPDATCAVDVLIDGTQIADIDPAIQLAVDEVVDASGLHLIPGVIDDHVHFREPGLVHKEDLWSASRACAKGGVTTFLEMPNTRPATTSRSRLHEKLALAARKSVVNYGFYLGATINNLETLKLATRTPGIKIFMGSSTGDLFVENQDLLERIFAETGLPICGHCEDETIIRRNASLFRDTEDVADHSRIRDHEAALVATRRAIDLACRHKHRFHVLHVSTAAEVDLFAAARPFVTAEVCPHHLFFSTSDYARLGTLVQVNPSIKNPSDTIGLWKALTHGLIQVVATDHAPHTLDEKNRPYPQSPSGIPAIENALALMLNAVHAGQCTLEQVVDWMCQAPARVWDIHAKGQIAIGYDADLVLIDLERSAEVQNADQFTKCGWSPWDGMTLTGWPVRTWVLGHEVFHDGRISAERCGREVQFDHARGGFWANG